jgi:glutamate-1-semialdehyde 2,1-aminomutase
MLRHGILCQPYVISAAHTGTEVEQTIEAAQDAALAYLKALETGRPQDLFEGRPVAPAHRRYAHPRELVR